MSHGGKDVQFTSTVLGLLIFKSLMEFSGGVVQTSNWLMEDFVLGCDSRVETLYSSVQLIVCYSSLHVPETVGRC